MSTSILLDYARPTESRLRRCVRDAVGWMRGRPTWLVAGVLLMLAAITASQITEGRLDNASMARAFDRFVSTYSLCNFLSDYRFWLPAALALLLVGGIRHVSWWRLLIGLTGFTSVCRAAWWTQHNWATTPLIAYVSAASFVCGAAFLLNLRRGEASTASVVARLLAAFAIGATVGRLLYRDKVLYDLTRGQVSLGPHEWFDLGIQSMQIAFALWIAWMAVDIAVARKAPIRWTAVSAMFLFGALQLASFRWIAMPAFALETVIATDERRPPTDASAVGRIALEQRMAHEQAFALLEADSTDLAWAYVAATQERCVRPSCMGTYGGEWQTQAVELIVRRDGERAVRRVDRALRARFNAPLLIDLVMVLPRDQVIDRVPDLARAWVTDDLNSQQCRAFPERLEALGIPQAQLFQLASSKGFEVALEIDAELRENASQPHSPVLLAEDGAPYRPSDDPTTATVLDIFALRASFREAWDRLYWIRDDDPMVRFQADAETFRRVRNLPQYAELERLADVYQFSPDHAEFLDAMRRFPVLMEQCMQLAQETPASAESPPSTNDEERLSIGKSIPE